jgi:hypothetical protein
MFALSLGIGRLLALRPEYQDFRCLVGMYIEAYYASSISRCTSDKKKRPDVKGKD